MKAIGITLACLAGILSTAWGGTWIPGSTGGWKSSSSWEGGNVPGAGGMAVIPSGEAKVTDADVEFLNSLGTVKMEAGARLVIEAATLTHFAFDLQGTGTVEKVSSTTWALDKAQPNWTGDWDFKSGKVSITMAEVFGSVSTIAAKPAPGVIYVRDGATLDYGSKVPSANRSAFTLGFREIHIAGAGVREVVESKEQNLGAIYQGCSSTMPNAVCGVILDADASILSPRGFMGLAGRGPSNIGKVIQNGHTLSLIGTMTWYLRVENADFATSPGPIVVGTLPTANPVYFRLCNGVNDLGDSTYPITLQNLSAIDFYNTEPAVRRPLTVDTKTGWMAVETVNATTNYNIWAGPVDLKNADTVLSFLLPDSEGRKASVSGKIGGAGSIDLKDNYNYSPNSGRIYLTNPANDYSGSTSVHGQYGLGLTAAWPGSIPDFTKTTLDNARLTVAMPNWSRSDLLDFLHQANMTGWSFLAVNADGMLGGNADLSFSDADVGTLADGQSGFGIAADGTGTVSVVSTPASSPFRYAAYSGTLKLTGSGRITLGDGLATAADATEEGGTVLFENAGDVSFGTSRLVVGYPLHMVKGWGSDETAYYRNVSGRVAVRNSRLYNHGTQTISGRQGFDVGYCSRGRLDIGMGAVVTNHLQVGGGASPYSAGVVEQAGGSFVALGAAAAGNEGNVRIGADGHGCFALREGELVLKGGCELACNGGASAVFAQYGGTAKHSDGYVRAAPHIDAATSRAVANLYFKGGSFATENDMTLMPNAGLTPTADIGSRVSLTLDGPDADVTVKQQLLCCQQNYAKAVVNLNAGILRLSNFSVYGRTGNGCYVNFNGGTLGTCGWDGVSIFQSVTRVTVFPGGATFDCAANFKPTVDVPLAAPSGDGIAGVTWTDLTTKYPGAPAVSIEGDGYGASAFAEWDPETGTISQVKVTSPGCDYRTATAVLAWGSTKIECPCTLQANDLTGGLSKTGPGSLTLNAANTYGGATTVAGGTLKIGATGTLPVGTEVVMAGGTLDLGTHDFAEFGVGTMMLGGGTVVNDAGSLVLPANLKVAVGSGAPTVFAGASVFPSGATVTVSDPESIPPDVNRYAFATFAGGVSGPMPTVVGLGGDWSVKMRGDTMVLSRNRGAILILR